MHQNPNHWSSGSPGSIGGNNNSVRFSPAAPSSIAPMFPLHNSRSGNSSNNPVASYPLIPGIIPGMITTTGSHVLQTSSSQFIQSLPPSQQYHLPPHHHPSLKSGQHQLIVPPAAHQPLMSTSLPNHSQGKPHSSRPSISSSINCGQPRTSSHGKAADAKKLKSNQEMSGQRAAILMLPQQSSIPYNLHHLAPAHHSNMTSYHHQVPLAQQFNPVQIVHRSPEVGGGGMKSQFPAHNLSSFPGNQVCDNNSKNSFNSLSNPHLPFNLVSRNNGNNNQGHPDPSAMISIDGSKKNSRKSDSSSSTSASNELLALNDTSSNNNHNYGIPSTSVSPTNSNHSSHSNSGSGAKSIKKFWVQKYHDTTGNGGTTDVTKGSNDFNKTIPTQLCQISPGTPATIPDGNKKSNVVQETSNKKMPGKKPKTMKSGIKGQKDSSGAASSETATGSESEKSEKVAKKKVKQKNDGDNDGSTSATSDESKKSGTKRPAAAMSGSKKAAAAKKKKVTDSGIGEEETESDSNTVTTPDKSGSIKDTVVDSEMTDVEDDESPTSGGKVNSVKSSEAVVVVKVPAKRGRKPKALKEKEEANGQSKTKPVKSSVKETKKSVRDKFTAEIMSSKSDLPFLQSKSCSDIAPVKSTILTRCRECKMTPHQKKVKEVGPSIFCRFYQFRKLSFHKELRASGFSTPNDAKEEDLKIWIPTTDSEVEKLKQSDAKFLIEFVGEHFCNLVTQERRALELHKGIGPGTNAWKSVVAGVREMCDVCDTTLFNIHWVCSDCGFVVCIDCYKSRLDEESTENSKDGCKSNESSPSSDRGSPKDRDKFNWLLCNSKQIHHQEKLMCTQIIAKSALWQVCLRLHDVKKKYLKSICNCSNDNEVLLKLIQTSSQPSIEFSGNSLNCPDAIKKEHDAPSPLSILADVAINANNNSNVTTNQSDGTKDSDVKAEADGGVDFRTSALRELLSKPAPPSASSKPGKKGKGKKQVLATQLNGVLKHEDSDGDDTKLNYFSRKITPLFTSKNLPPRTCTNEETSKQYTDIPHEWFCDGRLLVLKDTNNDNNINLFEQQWLRHQVMLIDLKNFSVTNQLFCLHSLSWFVNLMIG